MIFDRNCYFIILEAKNISLMDIYAPLNTDFHSFNSLKLTNMNVFLSVKCKIDACLQKSVTDMVDMRENMYYATRLVCCYATTNCIQIMSSQWIHHVLNYSSSYLANILFIIMVSISIPCMILIVKLHGNSITIYKF